MMGYIENLLGKMMSYIEIFLGEKMSNIEIIYGDSPVMNLIIFFLLLVGLKSIFHGVSELKKKQREKKELNLEKEFFLSHIDYWVFQMFTILVCLLESNAHPDVYSLSTYFASINALLVFFSYLIYVYEIEKIFKTEEKNKGNKKK